MKDYIAPNFPSTLPCGGKMEFFTEQDGFDRNVIYIRVLPRASTGWTAPCSDWRIAQRYAEHLAVNGVPTERGAA